MFITYEDRRKATLAVLDFVERFGANTNRAMSRLDSMQVRHQGAATLYLSSEYEGAKTEMDCLLGEFGEIDMELMRAKERALLWIYVMEWTSVCGVMMVCSFALWTLMIRRRLYRKVGTTRSL